MNENGTSEVGLEMIRADGRQKIKSRRSGRPEAFQL